MCTLRIILQSGTTRELASSISLDKRSASSASFFLSSSLRSSLVSLGGPLWATSGGGVAAVFGSRISWILISDMLVKVLGRITDVFLTAIYVYAHHPSCKGDIMCDAG